MYKEKCCKQCGQVKFMGTMTKWPKYIRRYKKQRPRKRSSNIHRELHKRMKLLTYCNLIRFAYFDMISHTLW